MRTTTCIGLLCCFATVYSQMNLENIGRQLDKPGFNNEISPLCMAGKCAGISYAEIQRLYRGLFFTKEEIEKNLIKTKNYTKRRQERTKGQILDRYKKKSKTRKPKRETWWYGNSNSTHDGDACCRTSISAMCPVYLINTSGTRRIIVHFPDMQPDPMYQFIPRGLCQIVHDVPLERVSEIDINKPNGCNLKNIMQSWTRRGGKCQTCLQEYALLNILVVDETFRSYPPLEFDEFYVKSYCSCKG